MSKREQQSRISLFLSFSLTFFVGLGFIYLGLPAVFAANVNVTAEVPSLSGICGDGIIDAGEVCDDGNAITESCGDNTVQSGNYCNSDCSSSLTLAETCDPSNSASGSSGCESGYFCNNSCNCQILGTPPPPPPVCVPSVSCGVCIGGFQACVQILANCNVVNYNQPCYTPACGNGVFDPGEECDDGNIISGDGCSAACQLEQGCGDGNLDSGEQCDDGNIISGDCCSTFCTFELLIQNISEVVTNTTGSISWTTPCQSSSSVLDWGQTPAFGGGSVSLSGQNYNYNIINLLPNTTYYYRITANAGALQAIENGSFRTGGGTEDCQNGIDDDSDGFIDYLDTECYCEAVYDCTDWSPEPCPASGIQNRQCTWLNSGTCWNNEPTEPVSRSCIAECNLSCGVCQNLNIETCICEEISPCCGNGICEPATENINICPSDCRIECISDWDCGPWEPELCPVSGIQTRNCFDRNACQVPVNPPATQRSCGSECPGLTCGGACERINIEQCICEEFIPCCGNGICESGESHEQCPQDCIALCTPNWTCLGWADCREGIQRRECYDLNNCNLNLDRPPEIRACGGDCDIACSTCQYLSLENCSCFNTAPCCGNNICEDTEANWSCPVDCGLPPEFRLTLPECIDGLDNDKDNLVDFPADPGCSKPLDNSELNFAEVIENIQDFIQDKIVDQVLNNPQVEEANRIVTPVLVTTVAVNTFATFSFFNFLTYLQFFFTQPFAALFRRKRRKWGVVYNSLTKQPVDLAIVRLYKKEDGRLVQSRVTDKLGRYSFLVDPGRYYLTVTKPKFDFPTQYLKDTKEDIKYLDLYHGETLEVTVDRADITANIPLDPKVEEKPVAKIIFQHYLRKVQYVAAFMAIPLAAVSMVISPGALTFTLFGFHCFLYILFRRLGYQKKPKNWGIVYDKSNKKPLGRAITRIYDKQYNKLLETRVTDARGRYSFLVNNNVYYVTAEKLGYHPFKTSEIDLIKKEQEAVIGMDIGLNKAGSGQPAVFSEETSIPHSGSEISQAPEGTIGLPAKLVGKSEVTEPKAGETQSDLNKAKDIIDDISLEERIDDLSVGRGSLEQLMKSKEKIKDIKEEIEDKKEDLEEMEEKVEQIQKDINQKLNEIDNDGKNNGGSFDGSPAESDKEPKKTIEPKAKDNLKEPPPEKSIFG